MGGPFFPSNVEETSPKGMNRELKHEGALYKEVFPGKIKAHLSVTDKVRGSNSKWRAI